MAQMAFSIRMDEALKRRFDETCADIGLNASAAFTVFAKAVVRKREIPFKLSAEPMPNEETLAAMKETEALLRDPSAKRYARFSDILSEVQNEV
jgi:addiction module RelB/DinJ family antitoxin